MGKQWWKSMEQCQFNDGKLWKMMEHDGTCQFHWEMMKHHSSFFLFGNDETS